MTRTATLAAITFVALSVPAPPQVTATDGPPTVRRHPVSSMGRMATGADLPPHPRSAPAPSSKAAAPRLRLSLMAAARRATSSTGKGARGDDRRAAAHTLTAADAIGWCESRNRYDAENPVSTASGRWQFVNATWRWVTGLEPPASAWPPSVQREAFLELWDDGAGASHWGPSRACWAPLLGVTP